MFSDQETALENRDQGVSWLTRYNLEPGYIIIARRVRCKCLVLQF